MRRLASVVAFIGLFFLSALPTGAQFYSECRYGFCQAGDGTAVIPVSTACLTSANTSFTFTAQGVGGANPTRTTVVTINWGDSSVAGTAELTAVTIGGVSMIRAVRATGDDQSSNSEIWYLPNPTGTSANIVTTFSTNIDAVTIGVYSLIGYSSVPVANTTGTTSVSQSYTNKQVALAAASRRVNVSTALSNMVNDFSAACGASLWGVHASQRLSGNGTLTSTISPTSNTPEIALAVWSIQAPACAENTAFIARTSGLSQFYKDAYANYICGLATDNVLSKFDFLYVFATADTTTAQLNLVSTSFNAILHGAPTFTANRGYTGVDGSTNTIYIETAFNPSTSPSPKYVLNSAHLSVWGVNNVSSVNPPIGALNSGPTAHSYIFPLLTSSATSVYRVNTTTATGGDTIAPPTAAGFFVANRTSSTAIQGYQNGGQVVTNNAAGSTLVTFPLTVLAVNSAGTIVGGAPQVAFASAGSSLSSTDVLNFYTRTRTFATTVGMP